MNNLQTLIQHEFQLAGCIYVDQDHELRYDISNPKFREQDEQIYAWVIDDTVMYVGMASKGIHKRLSEHRGGWRGGSVTGVRKAEMLKESINSGKYIQVYGRKCDSIEQNVNILGVDKTIRISLIKQEEDELISQFQPAWNVVGK